MNLALAEELCRRFEGFRSKPYLCPAGVPTIGYGSTHYADGRKVTLADAPISEADARALLVEELFFRYAPATIRLCPGLLAMALRTDDWRALNAIVDFVYNLGAGRLQTSTLRRCLNAQDWDGAREQLGRWVWAGGRRLPGLVRRRAAEAALLEVPGAA